MPSKTFGISIDSMIVSPNLGAGAGSHLMMGRYSGYTFRSLLKFNLDWSGVQKITGATLYLKNANQQHASYGSSPRCDIYSLSSAFSEGSYSCESGYSGSNSVVYPGPGATLRNSSGALSNTEGAWQAIGITELIEYWAPASVLKRDGSAGSGGSNYGLRIQAQDESTSGDVLEWYSRSTSYDPYIVLDYEDNQPPGTPTVSSPTAAQKFLSTATPQFIFSAVDPDTADTLSLYNLQVATDSGFASKVWDVVSGTSGISGWTVTRNYAGTALVPGTKYYYRANVRDNRGAYSPWSATRDFTINRPPAIADADLPNAKANGVLPIHNLALLATTLTPSPEIAFTPRDPDADLIKEYEIEITGTGANEVVTGSFTSGTKITRKSTKLLTAGTGYQLRIRAKDSLEYGAWSNYVLFKVWYSQAIYEFNTADKSSFSASLSGATGRTQLLYRTATGAAGAGAGSWRTSLPAPPPPATPQYINIMLRTSPELGTAPTQPGATKLTFGYTSSATPPFNWAFVGAGNPWSRDESQHKSGGNSLKCDLDAATVSGTTLNATQDVDGIDPTQNYVLSAWIKGSNVVGSGNATIRIYPGGTTTPQLKASTNYPIAALGDWQRIVLPLTPEDIAGNTSLRVGMYVTRGTLPTGVIWFDDVMLSEGVVAPAYVPAVMGPPAVLDASGVVIDGKAGGVFQLIGSAGGARDIVELGVNGLKFGGDTELSSPSVGKLAVDGVTLTPRAYYMLGPFERVDVPASLADGTMALLGAAVASGAYAGRPIPGRAGRILGMSYRRNGNVTAGSITLTPTVAGTVTGTPVVIDNTSATTFNDTSQNLAFSQSASLGINIQSTSTLTPATVDVMAFLLVEFND